jgi:signal transduction histidine kinase
MIDSDEISAPASQLERYTWALAVLWTGVVAASLMWNVVQGRQRTLEVARIQARSAYEKDIIYRRWNTMHGGVYVPVTAQTQPNPYLDVPDREITTPTGKELTLMNPAYMTRQVHQLAEEQAGVRGHITSLNPIRPENAADPWETEALKAFERGESEASSVEKMEGVEYMRLMRPLTTEQGCLKCHAAQGYEEGDIRGGISVSIPMEPLAAVARTRMLVAATSHLLPWVMGLAGIVLPMRRLSQSDRERRAAELELETRAQELEAASKGALESDRLKSVFLATVSHELRTPLNSIIGFTGAMLQGLTGELSEEQRKQLGMVSGSGKHLLSLINDVLDISKIEAGEIELDPSKFDLSDLVQEVVNTVTPTAQTKGLEMVISISPQVGKMYTDRRRVEQILLNLVNNAIKFTEEGEVRIEAQIVDGNLQVKVQDTGIGIREEDIAQLFQPFRQVDDSLERRYQGTGLGLSICKRLVDLLGGEIWAESEYGAGSTFTFTLPLTNERKQA